MREQAPKGGCTGVNGEWYQGGRFLPSTEQPKRHGCRTATGKQEIQPYEWEVPPAGFSAIFHAVRPYITANVEPDLKAVEYYGVSLETVEAYTDLYNSGYRYIAEESRLHPLLTEKTQEYIVLTVFS